MEEDGRDLGEQDLHEVILQMHEDWTAREEQFRLCVSELQEIAETSEARAEELEKEVYRLREQLLENKLQSSTSPPLSGRSSSSRTRSGNNGSCNSSSSEPSNDEARCDETYELHEYLKCSFLECSDALEKKFAITSERKPPRGETLLRLKDYLKYVALPLALHYTLSGVSQPDQRHVSLVKWHEKAVLPIQSLEEGSGGSMSDSEVTELNRHREGEEDEEEFLKKIIDSVHELSFGVNRMPFDLWMRSLAKISP